MMIDDRTAPAPGGAPGRTTVSARALEHLAVGLARDLARVPRRDVSVALADDQGSLRVSVTVPVALQGSRRESVVDSGAALRHGLISGMQELAGRTVGTVDIRYSGVRKIAETRVA